MKITYVGRDNLPHIRHEIDKALKGAEESLGVKLRVGDCRFTHDACTFKLELSTIKADGEVITPEAARFRNRAHQLGLKPTDLFEEFEYDGDRYRIIGLSQKVRRFPIIVEQIGAGGRVKFTASSVRAQLELARGAQS